MSLRNILHQQPNFVEIDLTVEEISQFSLFFYGKIKNSLDGRA